MNVTVSTALQQKLGLAENEFPLESSLEPIRDLHEWLCRDRIYGRLLADVAWNLQKYPVQSLIVVDRSQVPPEVQSPPWPLDVVFDMGNGKTMWLSHVPRESGWYDAWQSRIGQHAGVVLDLANTIERCLPVLAMGQFDTGTPTTIDWVATHDGRTYLRLETRHAGTIRWIRSWTIGKPMGSCFLPLVAFSATSRNSKMVFEGIEDDECLEIPLMTQ